MVFEGENNFETKVHHFLVFYEFYQVNINPEAWDGCMRSKIKPSAAMS